MGSEAGPLGPVLELVAEYESAAAETDNLRSKRVYRECARLALEKARPFLEARGLRVLQVNGMSRLLPDGSGRDAH